MNEEQLTLHLETFNNEEYILADECIKAIGIHRRTNTELHQTIEEKDQEIERLNNIIKRSITKVQEVKNHIDKSNFDGTTKSILIMALNEIIYSLNGKGVDKE